MRALKYYFSDPKYEISGKVVFTYLRDLV
jgi:hypothetical protein